MGFPVLRPLRGALALLAFLGVVPLLPAQTGYGYRKGQDPMVLSVKKIVLAARRDRWAEAVEEAGKLEWFFKEIREDLRVDLGKDFREAAGSRSEGPSCVVSYPSFRSSSSC